MFFRVVDSSRHDGMTRVTVEAEDSAVKLLLQFLATASDFAYLLRYKSDADLKAQDRAVERLAAEPSRRAHGDEILSLYRSMKGVPQHKRFQRIREMMKERGFDYTYSNVEGLVTRAIHDEQDERELALGAVGSPVVQRKGANAKVPTRVPSPQPDHRVRLVGGVASSAHRREAGSGDTARRHDAKAAPSPPPRIVSSTERAALEMARLGEGNGQGS
jgi:hypothetical protein